MGSPLDEQQDNKEVNRTPTKKINIESVANEEVTIIQAFDEDNEMDNIEITENTKTSAALPVGNTNFNLCTLGFHESKKVKANYFVSVDSANQALLI